MKPETIVLTSIDYEVLQLIHTYHFLTVAQLVRLRYAPLQRATGQNRLKRLADGGYLLRRQLPHIGKGNTDNIYSLSTSGQDALKELGIEGFTRVRKDDFDSMQLPHLQHVLDLNDFLIAASLLNRVEPLIHLVTMQHDLDLKRTPITLSYDRRLPGSSTAKEQTTIIPDGWLDVRFSHAPGSVEKRRCLVLEIDRGTTSQPVIKQKFRAYYHYGISQEYVDLFGTDLILVVYVTLTYQRMRQLLTWCQEELEQQKLTEESNLFRFGMLPTSLDCREMFVSPSYFKPFDYSPLPLLWQV